MPKQPTLKDLNSDEYLHGFIAGARDAAKVTNNDEEDKLFSWIHKQLVDWGCDPVRVTLLLIKNKKFGRLQA